MASLLIVEDRRGLREMLVRTLGDAGHAATPAGSVEEGLSALGETRFDLVVTDLKLPDQDGLALLSAVREREPDLPVIVMTAYGTVADAVEAMKRGAFDFLEKPFPAEALLARIDHALTGRRLAASNRALREDWRRRFGRLIGSSDAMQEVYRLVEKVAPATTPVLILGESGTGKELVAREIHDRSPRAEGPFVPINCAALPETLLESELFGHEKGAFTGAGQVREGRLELAHGGTVFLDEIGDLDGRLQVKLLRFLQEKEIERVGGSKPRKLDVRVLAATNRDLDTQVETGAFREDFFYRLNVIRVELPPLRERREDVPELAEAFLERYTAELHRPATLTPAVLDRLLAHPWPGNVRELENVIERLVVLAGDGGISADDLPGDLRDPSTSAGMLRDDASLPERLAAIERAEILRALSEHGGNQTAAAEALGMSRSTLQYRMKKHAVDPDAPRFDA